MGDYLREVSLSRYHYKMSTLYYGGLPPCGIPQWHTPPFIQAPIIRRQTEFRLTRVTPLDDEARPHAPPSVWLSGWVVVCASDLSRGSSIAAVAETTIVYQLHVRDTIIKYMITIYTYSVVLCNLGLHRNTLHNDAFTFT